MARHNYFKSLLSCLIVISLILALSFTSSKPVSAASYYDYCTSEALITLNDDIEDITIAEEIASKYGYEYKGIYEWDPSGPKTVVIDTHATEGLEDILAVLLSDESIKEVLFLPQYVKRILTLEFNKEVGEETVAREILAPYPCEIVRSRTVDDSLYVTVKIADGADYWSVRRDLLLDPNVNYGYMSWIPVNNTPYAPIVDEEGNESPIAEKPEFIDNTNEEDADYQSTTEDEKNNDTSNIVNNNELDKLESGKDYVDGEVLVVFNESIDTLEQAYELTASCGCEVIREISWTTYEMDKMLLVSILDGSSVNDVITRFEETGSIYYAQPNYIYRSVASTNDNQAEAFWHLNKIGVYDAWNFAECNGDVSVAVISDGIQFDHPDLASVINTDYAWDISYNCPLTGYYGNEGTQYAGIISAVANNSVGAVGVSHNAQIIPINVMWNPNYELSTSALIADAYDYLLNEVTDVNLRVINIGFYETGLLTAPDNALKQKIQLAASLGIATVCPGGDLSTLPAQMATYPSDYDGAIAVTATDSDDNIRSNCTGGQAKDIAAPGESIYTTTTNSSYTTIDGTGSAAAIVSGVLALMFAANDDLTVDEAKYILYSTAVEYTPAVPNVYYGAGRIDAKAAVRRAMNGPWTRLFGSNRYYTMQAVSQEGWADNSCDTVIVATGADFPDALAGSALAGLYGSPIILTNPNSLSPAARAEIIRLNPDHVIILGSASAVSDSVKTSIGSIVGSSNVSRIYGSNRYGTSKAIYDAGAGNWSDTLILATGATAPDALSIAPYAYASGSPIFLVKSDGETLLDGMRTAISNGAFEKVIIVGAPEVISSNLETWVKSQVGASNVIRLYGSNRYKTSSAIAEWESGNMTSASFGPDTQLTYTYPGMAHGGDDHFADALAGGSFCGHNGSVLLLTKDLATSANYTVTHNVVPHRTEISNGFVIGSSEVLSIDFLNYLNTVTVQ